MLRAQNIMRLDPITISHQVSIVDACRLMEESACHHLPVIRKNHHFIGLITYQDVLLLLNTSSRHRSLKVAEVMDTDVLTCLPTTLLADIAATLMVCKISAVPVIQDKKLMGLVTRKDLLYLIHYENGMRVYKNATHLELPHVERLRKIA